MRSLNPVLFLVALALFLLTNRVYALVLPNQFYFSFSAFLLDNRDLAKLPALMARLSQPLLLGFLVTIVLWRFAKAQTGYLGKPGPLQGLIEDQAAITLAFAGGASALLLAWPYILMWDLLIDPELASFRALYLLSYVAYVVGFGFFALSGAETARVFAGLAENSGFSFRELSKNEYLAPVYNALSGVVATSVAAFLAGQVQ